MKTLHNNPLLEIYPRYEWLLKDLQQQNEQYSPISFLKVSIKLQFLENLLILSKTGPPSTLLFP